MDAVRQDDGTMVLWSKVLSSWRYGTMELLHYGTIVVIILAGFGRETVAVVIKKKENMGCSFIFQGEVKSFVTIAGIGNDSGNKNKRLGSSFSHKVKDEAERNIC